MLLGMNGLFVGMPRGGDDVASTQSNVARSRIEAVDRTAWRARFRAWSELTQAADTLSEGAPPDSVVAGLSELHRAWHCLALYDFEGTSARYTRAYELFERHQFGLGIERLRSVKAPLLLRSGKSQAALDALNEPRRARFDETLPEARYVSLNIRALPKMSE